MMERDQLDGVSLGIEALAQALKFETFPCAKQDLAYSVGALEVEDAMGRPVLVAELLASVQESRFMTARDALSAICRAAELRQPHAA